MNYLNPHTHKIAYNRTRSFQHGGRTLSEGRPTGWRDDATGLVSGGLVTD